MYFRILFLRGPARGGIFVENDQTNSFMSAGGAACLQNFFSHIRNMSPRWGLVFCKRFASLRLNNKLTVFFFYKHDAGCGNEYFSQERYMTAFNALSQNDSADGAEYAKSILSGRFGFMCQYEKSLNFDTVWSSVFDITNGKVYRAEGNPQRKKFSEDGRLNKPE